MSFQPNTIYCGDCKEVLRHFPENCVDLIYLDPPFFSNRQYEVIWGDGYELRAFEDRWKGGINNYIAWMEERLRECHRVLKENGSIYLHCDWHADAHLRILMDRLFGDKNFKNELIWFYKGGGSSTRFFSRKHDVILFYSKGDEWTFNLNDVRVSYSPEILSRPKSSYRHHHYGSMSGSIKKGTITDGWNLNPKGKRPDDVFEFPIINPEAKERLGYPTQKPEALVEIFVKASSNQMDIVLDPFCGCGTAIAVAHKLGRRWIGIDVSPTACKLMEKRMKSIRAKDFRVIGLPKTLEDLKKLQPFEFQNWVMEKLYARVNPKKIGDMGIDGYYLDGTPIQVKQSEDIGRNVIDNFETAIQRTSKNKGVIVAFSFGKGAYEEVARVKLQRGLEITLKTVEEILKET